MDLNYTAAILSSEGSKTFQLEARGKKSIVYWQYGRRVKKAHLGKKMKIYPEVLTSFIKPQFFSISRCCFADDGKEMDKSARAERAKLLFLPNKYANV